MSADATTTRAAVFFYYLRPGGHLFKVPETLRDEAVAPVNCALSQVLSRRPALNEAFAASEWLNRETTTITRAALAP